MLRRTKFNPKIADMLNKGSLTATIGAGVLLAHHFLGPIGVKKGRKI
jgi:hypothetical protein